MAPEIVGQPDESPIATPLTRHAVYSRGAMPSLRMLRLALDMPRLMELGRRRRLPLRDVDEGYLVHCQLGELFGDLAPRPFAVRRSNGRLLDVVAYSAHAAEDLRRHADAFAEPGVHAACEWAHLAEKPMPGSWSPGTRLRFEVRLCPVVRTARDAERRRAGAEVDAYLAAVGTMDGRQPPSREEVYRAWLSAELEERRGGVRVLDLSMTAFRIGRFVRRTHGADRRSRVQDRPDVTMTGELEVTSADQFDALLRRGVGRHRGFGFGMLLLRPPRRR